eukprot:1085917-Pyramimonas_sp.AAC.1
MVCTRAGGLTRPTPAHLSRSSALEQRPSDMEGQRVQGLGEGQHSWWLRGPSRRSCGDRAPSPCPRPSRPGRLGPRPQKHLWAKRPGA